MVVSRVYTDDCQSALARSCAVARRPPRTLTTTNSRMRLMDKGYRVRVGYRLETRCEITEHNNPYESHTHPPARSTTSNRNRRRIFSRPRRDRSRAFETSGCRSSKPLLPPPPLRSVVPTLLRCLPLRRRKNTRREKTGSTATRQESSTEGLLWGSRWGLPVVGIAAEAAAEAEVEGVS